MDSPPAAVINANEGSETKPLVVIQDIDTPTAKSLAKSLIAKDEVNIVGLKNTTSTDPDVLLDTETDLSLTMLHLPDTSVLELRAAYRPATTVYLNISLSQYLHEHSTLSLASVSRKTPEEVAALRQWQDCRNILDAVPDLKHVILCGGDDEGRERHGLGEGVRMSKLEKAIRMYILRDMEGVEVTTVKAQARSGNRTVKRDGDFFSFNSNGDWTSSTTSTTSTTATDLDYPFLAKYVHDEPDDEFDFSTKVYTCGRVLDEDEAEKTSIEMVRKGFKNPTVWNAEFGTRNVNGRDRRDWLIY
ncbi:hypothetical protein EK21DRAFT_112894 [Setomelanomma holmii]|uniref:Uncharacterized protein n=1 Tax=Setomelanomma holmii TaxID=210430 RepID=A0A9P4LMC1_9PLEO|nr:hypothetical protein EK21DRAFT_112894 [Setomelanomma holmii]